MKRQSVNYCSVITLSAITGLPAVAEAQTRTCSDSSQCAPGYYCEKADMDCFGIGHCTRQPDVCVLWVEPPVCGCDGRTYPSRCFAATHGVNVAWPGTCGGVPVPPQIADWQSILPHQGRGDLGIVLNATRTGNGTGGPTVEPRLLGIQRIQVRFTQPMVLVGPVVLEDLTRGVSIPAVQTTFTTLNTIMIIQFLPGAVPDGTCCRIDLSDAVVAGSTGMPLFGDTECLVRALVGDTTGDGNTDLIDMAQIKSKNDVTVDSGTVQFDVNCDGSINLIDMALTKSRNGHAVSCP